MSKLRNRRVALVNRDLAELDAAVEVRFDACEPAIDLIGRAVVHQRPVASDRGRLRDARAHGPAADHEQRFVGAHRAPIKM